MREDEILDRATDRYINENLKQRDVEVFERRHNILTTSEGYYCVFYASDLKRYEE